jgi:hypothetical protein
MPLTGSGRFHRAVGLIDADPEFGVGVPQADEELARRTAVCPEIDLERGLWHPPPAEDYGDHAFGLVILDGMITREVVLADRSAAQLLGPGDVVTPWANTEGLVPAMIEWTVNAPTRLAVLDDRVLLAARRWPSIMRVLTDRLASQTVRLSVHNAIAQLPRVDARVLAVLWHLSERFGRVTPTGVVLPLRLTHEAIGRLVGAQRPTVTLALRDLLDRGAVERRDDEGWLLREGTQVDFAPELEPLSVNAIEIAAVLGRVPDIRTSPPRLIAQEELDQLRLWVKQLSDDLPDRRRYVDELLHRCRETKDRSASTRERIHRRRGSAAA